MYKGALTSMGSTVVNATLTATNAGEKLAGFSNINAKNVETFNGLAGSLAGQGVNFALGGDFTVNVLNFGMFNENKYNTGLLELHFDRDGTSMNFGTGGADLSFHTFP